MNKNPFKTKIGQHTFYNRYALTQSESWAQKAHTIVDWVCGTAGGQYESPILSKDEREYLVYLITTFKFLPGGRYIYYAGRPAKFWNNCFCFKSLEDTREDWAELVYKVTSALMTGGGIGNVYTIYRPEGRILSSTGGVSSGPIPAMKMVNEIGRNVMQGGSRRSACWAGLHWYHEDIDQFLTCKDWPHHILEAKEKDFNFPAPLDMTNISVLYDDSFEEEVFQMEEPWKHPVFLKNVEQALRTGEPGFCFDMGHGDNYLHNACTEFISDSDSDVCNLGSINMGAFYNIVEFKDAITVAAKFLVCGSIRSDVPFEKVRRVRSENRRIGLGLMGIHEWLLKRKYKYEINPELEEWLQIYEDYSEVGANEHCDRLYINRPKSYRAIAPNGTTGIMAATTTGIEPLYAVAYKRRYLVGGDKWKYEYVIDGTAEHLMNEYGINPEDIETALSLAKDPERRIKFQAGVQKHVDMGISSTINLPEWGSKWNNADKVEGFAKILFKYHKDLRGFTCYPDGARGGQPLTVVPYEQAKKYKGVVFEEHDICEITGHGGSCGI